MKKFSKITGEKVAEMPEIINEITDYDVLKFKIHKLMDNYLGVQMYGPITRYSVAGSTKVIGKELFLEALMDMLDEFSSNEKVKLLENLKSESSDWKMIDSNVDKIKEHLNNITNSKLVSHKKKIRFLLESKYSLEEIDISILKIKNPKTAYNRCLAIKELMSEENLNKDSLNKLYERYINRYNALNS